MPCLIYVVLIASSNNFVTLILSQQGDVMKQSSTRPAGLGGSDFWGSSLFLLTGVLWWAAFRAIQVELKGAARRVFCVVFLGCFVIDVLTCLATFDRTNLMPLLAGLTVIYLFFKTRAPM